MNSMLERCLALLVEEDRLGDLTEAFAQDVRFMGEGEARRRHRRHILTCILSVLGSRIGALMQNEVPTAAAASLIAVTGYACLVRATADTWWVKSGFDRNPGYFVSENEINYPVCGSRDGEAKGSHVTAAWSHAVLVPKSARITEVFCGVPGKPIGLSDDNYTRGRVLTAPVAFRVVWED